jgi:superoxide dismutase, Fe-Mn family
MNTSRRKFIEHSFKAATVVVTSPMIISVSSTPAFARAVSDVVPAFQFSQVPLPYANAALEPSIDATTMDIHYNKHHTSYIKNVNDAITAEKISFANEMEFFKNASKLSVKAKNNGGGAWNHNFFWQVMRPSQGENNPSGKLADAISGSFDSLEKFKEKFTEAAMTRFGSGWAWLVSDNGKLKIGSTPNQDNPLMDTSDIKGTPIIGIDVWEHAYYLKYQNKRNEYVANWWKVVNWDEASKRLA